MIESLSVNSSSAITQIHEKEVLIRTQPPQNWLDAVKGLIIMNRATKRHYWIHTDGDKDTLSTKLKKQVHWEAGSLFRIFGKEDISSLHAMQQMFCADVLIPAYSAMSISMALLTSGVVLYPRRKNITDATTWHKECKNFCGGMYGPPFDDEPDAGWAAALGNWYAVSPNGTKRVKKKRKKLLSKKERIFFLLSKKEANMKTFWVFDQA